MSNHFFPREKVLETLQIFNVKNWQFYATNKDPRAEGRGA